MLRALAVSVALLAASAVSAIPAAAQLPLPPTGGSGDPPPPDHPPAVAPALPGTDAVATEGLDSARDNWSGDAMLRPPFGVLWKANLPEDPEAVVTGAGRVFVKLPGEVIGLDGANGHVLWRLKLTRVVDVAFAGGLVLVASEDGLRGVSPATGAVAWTRPETKMDSITPVGGDVVFNSTAPQERLKTKLVDAATGTSRWEITHEAYANDLRAAAAGDRIYFGGDCNAEALDRRNGAVIWTRGFGCSGGGHFEVTRLVDTRLAITVPGTSAVRWLQAADGADASLLPEPRVLADGVGVFVREEHPIQAYNVADGASLWSFSTANPYLPTAVGVADQLVVTDAHELHVLGLHDGQERWAARVQHASRIGPVIPGAGLLLVEADEGLLALAPRSRTGPPRLKLELPNAAHEYGRPYVIPGTVGIDLTRRSAVRVVADKYPYGRGATRAHTIHADMDGRFELRLHPKRATRYRLSAEGGKPRTWFGLVLPRYRPHFTHPTPTSVLARVSVRLPRSVRAGGHVFGLYLGQAHEKRFLRLGRTRLHGGHGSFRATVRFRALSHVKRTDFIAFCIRGIASEGIGFGDRFERRCGAASVRYQ